MRVAVDATPIIGARTGVGVFAAGVIEALARRDDVDVVAYAVSWRGRTELAAQVPADVVATSRPAAARLVFSAWQRFDRPRIEAWTGPVDVVHATNFVGPPARVPSVVTVHDLSPLHYPDLVEPVSRRFIGLIRRALARGAQLHAHTAFGRDELVSLLGVEPDRVTVVHPGFTPLPDAAPLPADAVRPGAARYIAALGTIEPRKDLPTLISAFDAVAGDHPDVVLALAGASRWGQPALDAAVAATAHRDRIVQLGYVSEETKAALLRGASVFAYPSLYEGFGFPPLEAMSVGTPVLTTRAGPLPEVVGDAALLVEVGDVGGVAAGLAELLAGGAVRDDLVRRGREQVARYSWERCAAELVALYRRLAA